MKLYSSPASPFARTVRALIIEAGLEDRVEIIDTTGSPLDPGSHPTALNPTSKIPVLERNDGPALYDSRVICRYLDAQAGAGLYPEPPRLWETLVLEATGHGIMEAALSIVYESRLRPEEKRFAAWTDAQWQKIRHAVAHLDRQWMSHLAGRMDMGQIAVGVALGYVDFRLSDRDWRAEAPALAAWYADVAGRPALARTRPVG